MFSFKIINAPKSFIIKEKIINKILEKISNIQQEKLFGTLNIVFVDNNKIKELNNNYRKKNSLTDVLSFHYYDIFNNLEEEEIAGEIILSEKKIIEQGKEYKLGSELEFYKLVIHSVFHIIGYDHEEYEDYNIMKEKEDIIWDEIFN